MILPSISYDYSIYYLVDIYLSTYVSLRAQIQLGYDDLIASTGIAPAGFASLAMTGGKCHSERGEESPPLLRVNFPWQVHPFIAIASADFFNLTLTRRREE